MRSVQALVVVLAVVAIGASNASATDWYVDVNAAPGGDGSAGHPFQKIAVALNHSVDGDRILVAIGAYAENLTIAKSVTILGDSAGGTRIQAGYAQGVQIPAAKSVWLQDLVIQGGSALTGGGISNAGTLVLVRCQITSCYASSYTNYADAAGGGIDNAGTLVAWSCSIDHCGASTGFSIFSTGGSALGAGLRNTGTAKLFSSTLWANEASTDWKHMNGDARGGAIYNTGDLRLVNSTVSGNSTLANNAYGGGIDSSGSLELDHSTITLNTATGYTRYSSGTAWGGGVEGSADVGHTVLSDNYVYDDNSGTYSGGPDFDGTLNSLGYDLILHTDNTNLIGDMTGVQTGVDPKLLPLADNGGPVQTHALDSTSPCIDTGNPDPFASPPYDARNYPRALWDPATGPSDLGAYESGGTISLLLTATPGLPLAAGATLALTTGGGIYAHPNLLVLVDLNGTPTLVPIHFNTFDQTGVIVLEGSVPAGLSGTTVGLRSWSLDANGKLEITNEALLTFQ